MARTTSSQLEIVSNHSALLLLDYVCGKLTSPPSAVDARKDRKRGD